MLTRGVKRDHLTSRKGRINFSMTSRSEKDLESGTGHLMVSDVTGASALSGPAICVKLSRTVLRSMRTSLTTNSTPASYRAINNGSTFRYERTSSGSPLYATSTASTIRWDSIYL